MRSHTPTLPLLQEVVAQRIKERSEQAAARLRAARAMLFRQLQERLPGTVIDDAFLRHTAHLPPEAVAAVAQGALSPAAAAAVAADVAAGTAGGVAGVLAPPSHASPAQRRSALLKDLLSTHQVLLLLILRSCTETGCAHVCSTVAVRQWPHPRSCQSLILVS